MLFLNAILLSGLVAGLIPVLIHLLNRKSARVIDWGAMQFLRDSLVSRRRPILLEEILLLMARCLLLVCIVLAVARPFVPAGSRIPWAIVLPVLLLSVALLGAGIAAWPYRRWRWWLLGTALAGFVLCAAAILIEGWLDAGRLRSRYRQDLAIVIDGSTSMQVEHDGKTLFERAVEEAVGIVEMAPEGSTFTVIVGGGRPSVRTPAPSTDRAQVLRLLSELRPVGGAMRALDAVAAAVETLAQGYHVSKQIVLIGDNQEHGWETDRPGRWALLKDIFKTLPSEPRLIYRHVGRPGAFRNLAVADVTFSRQLVGTDRDVGIDVRVANSGEEPVTPESVSLDVEGETLTDNTVGLLAPGESETVRFRHRFRRAGCHVVSARVKASDDLPADDRQTVVKHVVGTLKVLIVDGGWAPRFLDRPGAFAALALAPGDEEDETGNRGGRRSAAASEKGRDLFNAVLIDAGGLLEFEDFGAYGAVVLADVPKIPAAVAARLTDYMERGGGVLAAPGWKVDTNSYNRLQDADGRPLMPATLVKRKVLGEDMVSLSGETFGHKAVEALAGGRDIQSVRVSSHWQLEHVAADADVSVCARLSDGSPFALERRVGAGGLLLLACALDGRDSNLVTRQVFVPLVHELISYLARPVSAALNVRPGADLVVGLSGGTHAVADLGLNGLKGQYCRDKDCGDVVGTRIDETVDFNWGMDAPFNGVPAEDFSVRWTGILTPPATGRYQLECESDDRMTVWIDGKRIMSSRHGQNGYKRVSFKAGKQYRLRVDFVEDSGEAFARLYWQPPGKGRTVVPASALSVGLGSAVGDEVETFTAKAPDGSVRPVQIITQKGGLLARTEGDALPGLYRLRVPEMLGGRLKGLAANDGAIPFAVLYDAAESDRTSLDDDDFTFLRKYVDIELPAATEDTRRALAGETVGDELWRELALAAFALVLIELLLARWVARQRRFGQEKPVDFEQYHEPSRTFREMLARLKSGS